MDDLEDPGAGLDVPGRGEGEPPGLAAGELDQGGGAELLVPGPVPPLALNTWRHQTLHQTLDITSDMTRTID